MLVRDNSNTSSLIDRPIHFFWVVFTVSHLDNKPQMLIFLYTIISTKNTKILELIKAEK